MRTSELHDIIYLIIFESSALWRLTSILDALAVIQLNVYFVNTYIISKSSKSLNSKIDSVKRNFIDERVKSFWNMLPCEVKNASSLNCIKYELETFKKKCSKYGESSKGHFWELSCEVLNRIERNGYVENKNLHNEYLKKNPFVAKAKFINLN